MVGEKDKLTISESANKTWSRRQPTSFLPHSLSMFTTLSVFSRSLCFVSSAISPSIRSLSLSQCLFLSALPLHLSLCLFPSLPLYMPPLLSVADFGLAKQKESEFSVMQSTVGTLSYWWWGTLLPLNSADYIIPLFLYYPFQSLFMFSSFVLYLLPLNL